MVRVYVRQISLRSRSRATPKFRTNRSVKNTKPNDDQSASGNSVIPGLNHVINTKQNLFRKTLWFIFLTANLVVCGYQIVDRILYYLIEPLRTDVSYETVKYLKMPSFTICPRQGIYPKIIQYHGRAGVCDGYDHHGKMIYEIYDILKRKLNVSSQWKMTAINESSVIVFEYMQAIGKSQPRRIVTEVSTKFGLCHTYTYPDPLKYVADNLILAVRMLTSKYTCWNTSISAYVIIHPDEDYPQFHLKYDDLLAGISKAYELSIKKIYRKSLKRRRCGDKKEVGKYRHTCFYDLLRSKVKCRNPDMPFQDFPICNDTSSASNTFIETIFLESTFDPELNCTPPLLVKCDETIFTKHLRQDQTGYDILTYSIPESRIDVIREEYAYSFVSLMCDIGGNLGLFLGLNLVSMVEIIEFVFTNILLKIKS